jgi:hypothetical protein
VNRFNRIFIGSCLTLASFTALAQDAPQINTSGNAFFAQCKPLNPSYSGCVFYVMGLTDGLQMLNATLEHMNTKRMFCLPSGAVTGEQTIDMMMLSATQSRAAGLPDCCHPHLHVPRSVSVSLTLMPCPLCCPPWIPTSLFLPLTV